MELKEKTSVVKDKKELKTVSFKEVHAQIEKESAFLKEVKKQTQVFKEKGDFLSTIGFKNSIATKMYKAITKNSYKIGEYEREYFGQVKFILEPQLERVCESYNLFVRPLEFFCGDIPETNITDLQNFKLKFNHLPTRYSQRIQSLVKWSRCENIEEWEDYYLGKIDEETGKRDSWRARSSNKSEQYNNRPSDAKNILTSHYSGGLGLKETDFDDIMNGTLKIPLEQLTKIDKSMASLLAGESDDSELIDEHGNEKQNPFYPRLVIAAVEDLFLGDAFEKSTRRIDKGLYAEPLAKAQVDLDPIVMYETADGYLIITAWGDEANDELVANQHLN